jgi:hypothetical protein
MAGSGPFAPIDHGWMSGSGSWMDKHRERKAKFLAEHPEWEIVYVRSQDRHEATSGTTDTELLILTDTHLGTLMDRLEARYSSSGEAQGDTA